MYLMGNMEKVPIRIIKDLMEENDCYNQLIYDNMHSIQCPNCNKELEELFRQLDCVHNTIKDLLESILNNEWKKKGGYYLMFKYHKDDNYKEIGLCDAPTSKELALEGWQFWKDIGGVKYKYTACSIEYLDEALEDGWEVCEL